MGGCLKPTQPALSDRGRIFLDCGSCGFVSLPGVWSFEVVEFQRVCVSRVWGSGAPGV